MYEVKDLVKVGGKEWKKNDMHRVYFGVDVLARICNIDIRKGTFFDETNLQSLNYAREAAKNLGDIWYDVKANEWNGRGFKTDEYFTKTLDYLKKYLNK